MLTPRPEIILFGDEEGTAELATELGLRHIPEWEARLRAIVFQRSRPSDSYWIDYLVFARGLFREIPPFAVGRWRWPDWLVWKALSQSVPVVDASTQVIAIHQNQRYDHLPEGYIKEVKSNEKLAGGIRQSRSIEDATHTLTAFESEIVVKPKRRVDMLLTSLRGAYQRRSLRMNCNAPLSSSMNPLFPWFLWFAVLNATQPFRHYLDLRRENLVRLLTRFRALG